MKKAVWFVLLLPLWLAGCSSEQPDSGNELFLKDVTLIDGTGAEPQVGVNIHISGGRIVEIGPDLSASPGAETIDGSGKYVIPGLIDAHVHLDAPHCFSTHARRESPSHRAHPQGFSL